MSQALPELPDFLWTDAAPKSSYDAIIIGGGGHGLATAYYLAKNHGITNVAVLERGWLAGGNMARNTTIIRSNYLWDESAAIYEHSLKLWEGLEAELGCSVLFSQRGVLTLVHNLADAREGRRRVNANQLNGIDAEWLTTDDVRKLVPILDTSDRVRYPVLGGTFQPRAGIAKHDWVAWGFARGAHALGVDIVQGCEVIDFLVESQRVTGVRTTRGTIHAGRTALCAAGHTTTLAASPIDARYGAIASSSVCDSPVSTSTMRSSPTSTYCAMKRGPRSSSMRWMPGAISLIAAVHQAGSVNVPLRNMHRGARQGLA